MVGSYWNNQNLPLHKTKLVFNIYYFLAKIRNTNVSHKSHTLSFAELKQNVSSTVLKLSLKTLNSDNVDAWLLSTMFYFNSFFSHTVLACLFCALSYCKQPTLVYKLAAYSLSNAHIYNTRSLDWMAFSSTSSRHGLACKRKINAPFFWWNWSRLKNSNTCFLLSKHENKNFSSSKLCRLTFVGKNGPKKLLNTHFR